MASDEAIVNAALIRIGAEPIASFAEESAQAVSARILYQQVIDDLIADHYWSFAVREQLLAELVLSDSDRRLVAGEHVYQLPYDSLRVIGLRSFEYFELAGDQMYTDAASAQCLYVARTESSTWPPWFVDLAATTLAARLAIAVTDTSSRLVEWEAEARRKRVRARALDSQQTPPIVLDLMRIYTRHRANPLAGT